tara:strand:- start:34756 stop:34926 length:171 start_codon:yes stop_codon:yes gene_type:complete
MIKLDQALVSKAYSTRFGTKQLPAIWKKIRKQHTGHISKELVNKLLGEVCAFTAFE